MLRIWKKNLDFIRFLLVAMCAASACFSWEMSVNPVAQMKRIAGIKKDFTRSLKGFDWLEKNFQEDSDILLMILLNRMAYELGQNQAENFFLVFSRFRDAQLLSNQIHPLVISSLNRVIKGAQKLVASGNYLDLRRSQLTFLLACSQKFLEAHFLEEAVVTLTEDLAYEEMERGRFSQALAILDELQISTTRPRLLFIKARSNWFLASENHENLIFDFVTAAKAGSVQAMLFLGALYYKGDGVKKNFTRAWTWFKLASLNDQSVEKYVKSLDSVVSAGEKLKAQIWIDSFRAGNTMRELE